MATNDMAKELLFDSIDLRFEEFGLPKMELDELDNDNNANTNLTKGTKNRKSRTRATRRKATVKAKARNKRLAKAKGYDLKLCSNPDRNGSRSVLSDHYSNRGHCKKWYPDSVKGMEQNKVSARELKEYPEDIVTYEDIYFYPLKRNYFNHLFGEQGYCYGEFVKGITDNVFCFAEQANTSVKEVLSALN